MAKMKHQPIDKDDWLRIIRRAELPRTTKFVAMHLAIFADKDGANARPGEDRMAAESGLTQRAVREHLEVLRSVGLAERLNRGTAVRGRADVYQLTVPGPGHDPVPMRWDPDGNRLTPPRPVRKRAKKTAEAEPAAMVERELEPVLEVDPESEVTGTRVPESGQLTGPGVPVDNSVTGTEVPESDAAYRNPRAGNVVWLATTYRNQEAHLPEPTRRLTGTPVPATTHTTQDHPSTGSPQVSTSPTDAARLAPENPNEIDQGLGAPPDAELDAARAVLAAMRRPVADTWRHTARTQLETAGVPLTKRAVEIRAAQLATQQPTATGGAA